MALTPIMTAWTFPQKLLLLLLIIFLPASGIIVASSLTQREYAIREAENRAMLLVKSLAAQQEAIATGTRQMLSTLAQLPEVQKLDADACNSLFRDIREKNPHYSTILAVTPDGTMFAASAPFERGNMVFADRKYLKDAVATRDFSAGEYIVGRLSNVATLNFSYPVIDDQGRLRAIVVAGFKLDQYAHFISGVDFPKGYALAIVDHRGVRLYRLPEVETNAPGVPLPGDAKLHIANGKDHGIFERTSQDGVKRIYAFKQLSLREGQPPYLYMLVGVPKEMILEKANSEMLRNLALLGTTALVAMCLAWLVGTIAILRPIKRLVEATRRFGKGEMGIRTGPPYPRDELGQLAASFDDMASQLEIRDMERKREEEERLQLEVRLHQAQKTESLSRMAGAIAHHFNNMLGAVMGNLELVQFDAPPGSRMDTRIAEAMNASRRAAEISRFMLTYLGQTTGTRCALDFTDLVKDTRSLMDAAIPEKVILKTEFPTRKAVVLADGLQIKQIVTSLLLNAVEAIGSANGIIKLEIRPVGATEIREPRLFPLEWKPEAENYVCLVVSDTGCGLDAGNLEKVFDPFFSTKFTGRGLGLSVSLGLARAHGGAISVASEPGHGATFKVFLPLLAEQETVSMKEDPLAPEPVRPLDESGVTLVVDDEPLVRKMAASMLKQLMRREVITACDGQQALNIFNARRDEISLVMLDLGMPGMDGWQALEALRELRPDIPVILVSGYDEARVMRDYHREMPQAFLHKPFRVSDLKAALRHCGM